LAIFAGQVIERQAAPRARTPKIGCSADQVYSQGRQCADNWRPEGWQATPLLERCREHAGRRGAGGCSGTCCTWARSTTRRNWRGGGRSRFAYIGKHPQPGFASLAPDKVNATITPDLLFTPHSSLLDLVFYEADQFPPEYKGSLFVALKGSWNRSIPTGYKVVRVPFKDGRPEGYYENGVLGCDRR
jgi:hypothetical protein